MPRRTSDVDNTTNLVGQLVRHVTSPISAFIVLAALVDVFAWIVSRNFQTADTSTSTFWLLSGCLALLALICVVFFVMALSFPRSLVFPAEGHLELERQKRIPFVPKPDDFSILPEFMKNLERASKDPDVLRQIADGIKASDSQVPATPLDPPSDSPPKRKRK